MWQAMQLPPAPRRIVVRVSSQRGRRRVLAVAADADGVAGGRGQPLEVGAPILAVRIVAGHARHLPRAAAHQEVARLARGDRAAPGVVAAPLSPFPGERIAREQHLVAAGAGAVDPFGPRDLARGVRLKERRARREVGEHARVVGVRAAAAVAGLAADAQLDHVAGVESPAQLVNPAPQRLRRVVREAARTAHRAEPRPRPRSPASPWCPAATCSASRRSAGSNRSTTSPW